MGSMCDYLVDDSLAPQVLHPIAASDLIPYGGEGYPHSGEVNGS